MFWQLPEKLLLDPQQMNSYSYARNNPINRSDPSGQLSWSAVKNFFKKFGNNKKETTSVTKSETPQFKLPLEGGKEWVVTVQSGGKSNDPSFHDYNHEKNNFYSIDFDPKPRGGNEEKFIPIYATADGTILENSYNEFNGNYISIDHDSDNKSDTGFQSRYIHLHDLAIPGPLKLELQQGQFVKQGQIIGNMGNTGDSKGRHLHFGIRYGNSGAGTTPQLLQLKIDGVYLKNFTAGESYFSTNR